MCMRDTRRTPSWPWSGSSATLNRNRERKWWPRRLRALSPFHVSAPRCRSRRCRSCAIATAKVRGWNIHKATSPRRREKERESEPQHLRVWKAELGWRQNGILFFCFRDFSCLMSGYLYNTILIGGETWEIIYTITFWMLNAHIMINRNISFLYKRLHSWFSKTLPL